MGKYNKESINQEIPIQTAFKRLLVENGKLKSEIAYLENELDCKNKAIEAFKKWQKKIVTYNVEQWYGKCMELLKAGGTEEDMQLREKYKVLKSWRDYNKHVLKKYNNFNLEIDKLIRHLENEEKLKKALLEEIETEDYEEEGNENIDNGE